MHNINLKQIVLNYYYFQAVSSQPPPVPPRRSLETAPSEDGPVVKEEANVDQQLLKTLQGRRDEYKRAAVAAKKAGDVETAKAHVRVIKVVSICFLAWRTKLWRLLEWSIYILNYICV